MIGTVTLRTVSQIDTLTRVVYEYLYGDMSVLNVATENNAYQI